MKGLIFMKKILFLEDEPVIREVLAEYMRASDYDVIEAEDGEQALWLLQKNPCDMAILDILVPGISGLEVLREIRKQGSRLPVIMLTALGDDQTQIEAFDAFADDFVVKPVSPAILLRRMETIFRRAGYREEVRQAAAGLVVEDSSYQVYYDGVSLGLTLSEFLLLHTLYQEPGRTFTREQLILRIYNEDYLGNDRIIDAHVKNLRKKLPGNYIRTVTGIGYQFQKEG